MEAEMEGRGHLQGHLEPPGAGGGRQDPPLKPLAGAWPCPHLDFGLPASRMGEDGLLVFQAPSLWWLLLWPQDTHVQMTVALLCTACSVSTHRTYPGWTSPVERPGPEQGSWGPGASRDVGTYLAVTATDSS